MPDHRLPYGDAFIIATPKIDELSNRLYAEERQRRLYKQQQDKSLDDEFKNVLPGVRQADVGKLANLWGDYKNSWIQLRRNPPKDQASYLNAQRDLLQKQAEVYRHVAGSKERSQDEKKIGGLVMSDKTGLFDDKAHSIIKQGLSQPYDQPLVLSDENGQEKAIDWTDPDQLKSHIDTKYVSDAINKAQGDRKATYIGDKEKDTDLQMPKIQAGNNPFDFYTQLMTKAAPKYRDFSNTLPHPTDNEYNDTLIQYSSLDPSIKKMWKMKEELPDEDEIKTQLQKDIKYQVMKYGLNPNNQPRVVGYAKDEALEEANKQKFAIAQQKRGADFAMERVMAMFHERRTAESEDDFKGIASILNNTKNIIDNGKPVEGVFGEKNNDLVEVSDTDILNAASKLKDAPINRVTFDKKKDQFNIEYDGWKGQDGTFHDAETIPLSRQDYLRLKVDKFNPKNKGKTNANIDRIITENGGLYPALQKVFSPDAVNQGKTKVTSSESKTYKLGDTEITEDQLKKGAAKYKMSVDQYKKSIGL